MSSRFSNPRTFQGQMSVMGQTPLQEHINVPSAPFNMHTVSRDLLLELELIEECDVLDEAAAEAFDFSIRSFDNEATPHGYKPRPPYNASVLWLVWDLRDRLAESVAIAKFLPLFFRDFCSNRMSNYGESEDVQFEFCASLLQVT